MTKLVLGGGGIGVPDHEVPRNATQILSEATPEQARWVLARLTKDTDQEAAWVVGLHRSTVSKWANKGDLDLAVQLLLADAVQGAKAIIEINAANAAKVVVDLLATRDPRVRLAAAENVLDRAGVVKTTRQELSGRDGEPLRVVITWDELA